MTHRNELLLLLVAFALLSTGGPISCGSSEESTPPAKPSSTARAQAQARVDREPVEPARAIADELAQKIELPDYFPSDAPVYPDTPPSQASLLGKRATVMFGTSDALTDVVEFMAADLQSRGWLLTANVEMPESGVVIQGTKGDRLLSILVSRVEEGSPEASTLIGVAVDQ